MELNNELRMEQNKKERWEPNNKERFDQNNKEHPEEELYMRTDWPARSTVNKYYNKFLEDRQHWINLFAKHWPKLLCWLLEIEHGKKLLINKRERDAKFEAKRKTEKQTNAKALARKRADADAKKKKKKKKEPLWEFLECAPTFRMD